MNLPKRFTHLPPVLFPIFVIAGPTAAGKSEIAVEVAERCGGEIVGADAFQVYRGLDILTAKPAPALTARVRHHLIGEVPLALAFDVAQYLALASERIAEIHARGRCPIVVGGTGLYLRALAHGLADLPKADASLRAELEKLPPAELNRRLAELDPAAAAQLDLKNPRRVIRALEVCLLTGGTFSRHREEWNRESPNMRGVVFSFDREELGTRIDRRTSAMFEAGVVDEVRQCKEIGPTASQTLGLREIRALIAGQMSEADCIATIQQSTRRYAKRQMTWFRREKALEVMPISVGQKPASIAEAVARKIAR
jgi:tRNA dimethylallyltransferase